MENVRSTEKKESEFASLRSEKEITVTIKIDWVSSVLHTKAKTPF